MARGFALSIANQQKQLNNIKTQLINLANQIEKKTQYINSLSTTIGSQMTANNKEILSKSSKKFWKEKITELGGDYLIWSNAPENPNLN
jgi:putative transcriptional regulator